jgi:hypothetical protein
MRLGRHSTIEGQIDGAIDAELLNRIGSDQGCTPITIPEGQFIQNIYIKASSEMVKTITLELNDGNRVTFGKEPLVE